MAAMTQQAIRVRRNAASSSFEILGQLLDVKRRFSSGVGYRFHALPRFWSGR
jgi:hypothetical protein